MVINVCSQPANNIQQTTFGRRGEGEGDVFDNREEKWINGLDGQKDGKMDAIIEALSSSAQKRPAKQTMASFY